MAPLFSGDMFQDPKGMPEIMDGMEPYTYYVFSNTYTHILSLKTNTSRFLFGMAFFLCKLGIHHFFHSIENKMGKLTIELGRLMTGKDS